MNNEIKTFEDLKYAAELCLKQNKKIKENFYVRIRRETANKKKANMKNKRNQKKGQKNTNTSKVKLKNKSTNQKKGKTNDKKNTKKVGKDVNNNNNEVIKCKNVKKSKSKNKVRIKRAGPDRLNQDQLNWNTGEEAEVVVDGSNDPCSDSEVGPLGMCDFHNFGLITMGQCTVGLKG